jgi:hypothetical protein
MNPSFDSAQDDNKAGVEPWARHTFGNKSRVPRPLFFVIFSVIPSKVEGPPK